MERDVFEPEHEELRRTVRRWVQDEIAPEHERFRREHVIDRQVWRRAGELGLLGLAVPEVHGGGGIDDFRFNAVVNEELCRQGLALGSAYQIHADVVAPYLLELTTEEQRRRWLPGFCTGETLCAIAMTEPGAGSDLAALRTTATREGDTWVLDGAKTFITNGTTADLVVVAARTTPDSRNRGISLFVVERGMPGFEQHRRLEKIGQPEADTAELFFDGVRLPADNLLGEVDGGWAAMMQRLPQERLSTAVSNVAHAERAVELTLEHVRSREAFGSPIGSFQHNKFLLAELVTELEVTRVYVDRCLALHVDGRLDATGAAKAKYWSADVQNRVIDACVQLHGGYGYMAEYDVARAWADARVSRIWAGSNEIMKELIGRSLGL